MSSIPTQAFGPADLKWMRRWRSQFHLTPSKGDYPETSLEWMEFFKKISQSIYSDSFSFDHLRSEKKSGRVFLSTKCLDEVIVLRKICDNIKRAYGINTPPRQDLIRTAKQALKESAPKSIIRIDIANCFESIDRAEVLDRIAKEGKVSHQTLSLIRQVYQRAESLHPAVRKSGLPRGLSISGILAEVKLQELHQQLRELNGVYLCLRYVDDFLIFSTQESVSATNAALEIVKKNRLQSSKKKQSALRIGCSCEFGCTHGSACPCARKCTCNTQNPHDVSFQFLGYKFIVSAHNDQKRENEVTCALSDQKVNRIKTRIFRSIHFFKRRGDASLLSDRLKYLTANQAVRLSAGKSALFNGLSYSHSEYSVPDDAGIVVNSLKDLDIFLRTNLRRIKPLLSSSDYSTLSTLSFASGFSKKRRCTFSAQRVTEITRCWQNVKN